MNKKIFTTQDVSRMLSCDLTTVIKWVNEDKLKAYKTPGGHRRIEGPDLVDFVKKFKLPFPDELKEENRVLIVDDDPDFVSLTAGYLQKVDNIRIDSANEGFMAGEKVISFNPHVVILDVKLPGIDGYEVCRRIKEREETKGIKIVVVTAYDSPQDRRNALESGADVYFAKPLKSDQFVSTVKKFLT
ncbi:MAG: response regulator [bacterium]